MAAGHRHRDRLRTGAAGAAADASGAQGRGPEALRMFANLKVLVRYRGLIQTLVARDLKARYRGSVLGFFWSFINPLLLLLIYSFVFTYVMKGSNDQRIQPYALFMFCGILPWTWFASSLNESAG